MSVEFSIYQKDGSDSGAKLVIETPAFDIKPHDHAIYLAVKAEMTNVRQGTHSAKTRGEVRGGRFGRQDVSHHASAGAGMSTRPPNRRTASRAAR